MIKVEAVNKRVKYSGTSEDFSETLNPEELYNEVAIQAVNSVVGTVLGSGQILMEALRTTDETYTGTAVEEKMLKLFYEVVQGVSFDHILEVYHQNKENA
ncbi:MAG: hypothetical protein IJ242_10450 [Clostridia bacterium]|nr:hypothetical protein [Clostridia bacterium]